MSPGPVHHFYQPCEDPKTIQVNIRLNLMSKTGVAQLQHLAETQPSSYSQRKQSKGCGAMTPKARTLTPFCSPHSCGRNPAGYLLLSPMTFCPLVSPPHAHRPPYQKEGHTHLKIGIIDIFEYQSWCLWLQERIRMLIKYSNNKRNLLLLHWPILRSHLDEKDSSTRERLVRKSPLEILCLEFASR